MFMGELDPQIRLAWKLRVLKAKVKDWARNNRKEKLLKPESMEQDISREYLKMLKEGFDLATKACLKKLQTGRNDLIKREEEYWRQKSRDIWLKCGDHNTRFFHNFATARRKQKNIWEIEDENGWSVRGHEELKAEAARFYKQLYSMDGACPPNLQVNLAIQYPQFVTEEDNNLLERLVTKQEIREILKHFEKDKSMGPDGWTMELFNLYFDTVGDDLHNMVEDSRRRGKIMRAINSTFLVLIPKENSPQKFGDFRPIALCNLCYKDHIQSDSQHNPSDSLQGIGH
jgi:hypothetical protein